MSLEELTSWLFSRTSGGIRWGLETTETLLAGVGLPHRRFHSLHVGGTNGKGSVAALCEAALRAAGSGEVGLYTSPHLVSFRERIRIGGAPAPEPLVVAAAERLRPEIERTGATFFEATTAIAFLCFAEAGVRTAVVEVGLGGRLDATNVIAPLVTGVTNVSREHTDYLGESLEAIAREKAGIFKRGIPAVSAERDPAVLAVLRGQAEAVGAPFTAVDDVAAVDGPIRAVRGTAFTLRSSRWGERRVEVALRGAHQARNALLAVEMLARLPEDLRPDWEAVEMGLRSARWPGRLQVERLGSTTWVLDVAHNPAGVAVLAEALDALDLPRPRVLVAGILADKEWREMLPPLLERTDAAVFTVAPTAPPARRWSPDEAAAWAASTGRPARSIPDLATALQRATTLAPHGTVIVTGSFHTVGDAMVELGVEVA